MRELRLSSGAVICYRPVPPYVRAQVYLSLEDPEPPTEMLESVAGHTEEVPIDDPNSPDFQRWAREVDRVRRVRAQRQQDVTFDYGITGWLLPSPGGLLGLFIRALRAFGIKNWRNKPPRGWKIPENLKKYGVGEYIDRRLSYIQIELIQTTDDLEKAYRVIGNAGQAGELTDEEVEAQEGSFRVQNRRTPTARSAATADTTRGDDSRGDSSREEMGS